MADEKLKVVSCGNISPEYLDGADSIEEASRLLEGTVRQKYRWGTEQDTQFDQFVCKSDLMQKLICKSLKKPKEDNDKNALACQWAKAKQAYPYYVLSKDLVEPNSTVFFIPNCSKDKRLFPVPAIKEARNYDFLFSDGSEEKLSLGLNLNFNNNEISKLIFMNASGKSLFRYFSNNYCWVKPDGQIARAEFVDVLMTTPDRHLGIKSKRKSIVGEAINYITPSIDHLMIELPEDFEGLKKFSAIIREDFEKNTQAQSEGSEHYGDPDFEIELDLVDAVLLRYLMSLYGANYDHLKPLENIEGGEAFYRRKYAFSEASILFYGDRAISALKKLAKADLSKETKISLLILAKKIDEMYVKAQKHYESQQSRTFGTVLMPPSLSLPMIEQALLAVFPRADATTPLYEEVDQIFDDLDAETGTEVLFVDAFDQSSFIRKAPEDYVAWNGLHMDELKLIYYIIRGLKKSSGAHNPRYTNKESLNIDPEDSKSPYFICVKSQKVSASMECRFRKNQYWKDLIGRLTQLKEASNYSYGLKARLDQLVKQAEDLYITLTDESGPEVARKSAWGSYGSLPYTVGVGVFGAVVGAVVTAFVKEPLTTWYKNRKKSESDKDDDDSNPPGVAAKGKEVTASKDQEADSKFQGEPIVNFDLERLSTSVPTRSNQPGSYHIPQFDKIGVARSYFEEAIPYIGVGAAIAGTALVVGTTLIRAGQRLAVSGPPAPPKLGAAAAAVAVGGIMVYASEAHATPQKTKLREKTYLVPVDSELGDATILSLRQNFPEASRTIEKVAGASQAVIDPFTQGLRSILGD